MSKARVTPLKFESLPRLELLACVVGARLAEFVKTALEFPPTYLYVVSQVTELVLSTLPEPQESSGLRDAGNIS